MPHEPGHSGFGDTKPGEDPFDFQSDEEFFRFIVDNELFGIGGSGVLGSVGDAFSDVGGAISDAAGSVADFVTDTDTLKAVGLGFATAGPFGAVVGLGLAAGGVSSPVTDVALSREGLVIGGQVLGAGLGFAAGGPVGALVGSQIGGIAGSAAGLVLDPVSFPSLPTQPDRPQFIRPNLNVIGGRRRDVARRRQAGFAGVSQSPATGVLTQQGALDLVSGRGVF